LVKAWVEALRERAPSREDCEEYSWFKLGVEAVAIPPRAGPLRRESVCREEGVV
jgi:hypothetical protein